MSEGLAIAQTSPDRAASQATQSDRSGPAWEAAVKLEGAFLSEMLKSAGFGKARDSFGGGAGEEQFASFMRDIHAQEMAGAGGIGLAEAIYRAMTHDR